MHEKDPLGCEAFALRSYLYALTGLVLFISSALGVGANFADNIANGSSFIISVILMIWLVSLYVISYTHSQFWFVKHIAAGMLAIISGLGAGVVARRLGLVPALRRSAIISAVFSSVATGIIFVSGEPCISGWQLVLCALASIVMVEFAASMGILELNILDEVKNPFAISIQRTISIGFLLSLFIYLLELSRRVCKRSENCYPGNADYIETVLAPYTKTIRILFRIVQEGCKYPIASSIF